MMNQLVPLWAFRYHEDLSAELPIRHHNFIRVSRSRLGQATP